MRATRTLGSLTLALTLAWSLSACVGGDSSTGPGEVPDVDASFDIDLSGDVTTSLSGIAVFATGIDQGEVTGFGVTAARPTERNRGFNLIRSGSSRPSPGQYDISNPREDSVSSEEFIFYVVYHEDDGNQVVLLANDGTVSISQSSATRLVGSVDAQMTGARLTGAEPDSLAVSATSTFDAISASEYRDAQDD